VTAASELRHCNLSELRLYFELGLSPNLATTPNSHNASYDQVQLTVHNRYN